MARIPLADPATLSGLEQAVYQRFPANLVLGLLRSTPELADVIEVLKARHKERERELYTKL